MAYIVDSYSESNYDFSSRIAGSTWGVAQSFTGDGGTLDSVKFYLKKSGSPTGNAVAKIYAHTGTYGTSSAPTGIALATSDNFDVSTLTGSFALSTLIFSGANKITLTNGTKYCVSIEYSGGTYGVDDVSVGHDESSPTHDGNKSSYDDGWTTFSNKDACFYVYADDTEPIVGPFPTFKRQ